MSEFKHNNKRTISYVRKVNTITGEVMWEPLWDLSTKPPTCTFCARRGSEFCRREPAPGWYGAECANWLPKDVIFREVNEILTRGVHDLLAYANGVWCDRYATPVQDLAMRIWALAEVYEASPLARLTDDANFYWRDKQVAYYRRSSKGR